MQPSDGNAMLIYDDVFEWQGFGGTLKLGSGKCRLKIYDLSADPAGRLAHLKPIIVVATDHPDSRMSVRSCSSHIVTVITQRFNILPSRLQFVEYCAERSYGYGEQKVIPEKFEAVDFTWKENLAMHAKIRPLGPPLLDRLTEIMAGRWDGEE